MDALIAMNFVLALIGFLCVMIVWVVYRMIKTKEDKERSEWVMKQRDDYQELLWRREMDGWWNFIMSNMPTDEIGMECVEDIKTLLERMGQTPHPASFRKDQ